MTPTEQEVEFFKKAKRIQELWEPKFGDWVCDPKDGNRIAILAHQVEVNKWQAYWPYAKRLLWADVEKLIFLPHQGQLQAMLEERGRFLMFRGAYMMPERRYQITAMAEDLSRLDARIDAFGPTPSIALGRALIEVMEDATIH